jgi:hypothetical protein
MLLGSMRNTAGGGCATGLSELAIRKSESDILGLEM